MKNLHKKRCSVCHKNKLLNGKNFYPHKVKYWTSACKKCHLIRLYQWAKEQRKNGGARDKHLRRMYGISQYDFNQLLKSQEHKCFICRKKHSSKKGQKLQVDHNHANNVIRSLLCGSCNLLVGKVERNLETIKQILKYLSKEGK